jgi:hypothetical protein
MDFAWYVEIDDAARRMGITVNEIVDLVRHRVLRGENLGNGLILVEPAILSGTIPTKA